MVRERRGVPFNTVFCRALPRQARRDSLVGRLEC
jgi:hypothetical protein